MNAINTPNANTLNLIHEI